MATTAGRVAGGGLALAALTIIGLAILVLVELEREARLQREVIAQIESAEQVDALREALGRLGPAARIAALTATSDAHEAVEAVAGEIEQGLAIIERSPARDSRAAALDALSQTARVAILNARSIGETRARRGSDAADQAALEAESLSRDAARAIDRIVDSGAARINRMAVRQIRIGETLRKYVVLALTGSVFMLGALFALYRGARRRERAAIARVEQMAHYDSVTGLPNRALLADRLEQEVARAHRSERPFALVAFDLDGFKALNDTWGHAAGDSALRIVADRAREQMRASDTVGRQGGDEFLALLPETSLEGALLVAEKLRTSLANPYAVGSAASATMGASFGVALFPAHGSDPEALLQAADAALYEAKRAGRNRVKVAVRAAALPRAHPLAAPSRP